MIAFVQITCGRCFDVRKACTVVGVVAKGQTCFECRDIVIGWENGVAGVERINDAGAIDLVAIGRATLRCVGAEACCCGICCDICRGVSCGV